MYTFLGQWFSSSSPLLELHEHEYMDIKDEEYPIDRNRPDDGSFNFTDGIGFCSHELMEKVKSNYDLNVVPSAIQVSF